MPRYRVIVTRDTSVSATVTVDAASAEEADSKALEYVMDGNGKWEEDDYWGKPYVQTGEAELVEDEEDPAVIQPDEIRRDGIMSDDNFWK